MARSRSVHFFATKHDLGSLLSAIESQRSVHYVRAGLLHEPQPLRCISWPDIPSLGIAPAGDTNLTPCWLIVDSDAEVGVEPVPQQGGGIRYAIDQRGTPHSVAFRPGGVFDDASVIAGTAGTCTDDRTSHELQALFTREIRHQFGRIREFYVGPEASTLADAGYRLTSSVKSPKEFDVTRD